MKFIAFTGINYILQYFTILMFYCIVEQINAALVSIRDFF